MFRVAFLEVIVFYFYIFKPLWGRQQKGECTFIFFLILTFKKEPQQNQKKQTFFLKLSMEGTEYFSTYI